jgi:hypothetical protein
MNRSVRRHLNKHKNIYFLFFPGFSHPLGGPKIVKKHEFSHFYPILRVFEPFDPFKHEKSTKTKVFHKICLELLKTITSTPGGNFRYGHPGVSNAKILTQNESKYHYYTDSDL